jgi:hypothetical protein
VTRFHIEAWSAVEHFTEGAVVLARFVDPAPMLYP